MSITAPILYVMNQLPIANEMKLTEINQDVLAGVSEYLLSSVNNLKMKKTMMALFTSEFPGFKYHNVEELEDLIIESEICQSNDMSPHQHFLDLFNNYIKAPLRHPFTAISGHLVKHLKTQMQFMPRKISFISMSINDRRRQLEIVNAIIEMRVTKASREEFIDAMKSCGIDLSFL